MIRHRQGCDGAVRILPAKRDVFALKDNNKAEHLQCSEHTSFGSVNRKFRHTLNCGFGDERFEDRFLSCQRVNSKRFYVEFDRGLHIPQRIFVSVSFTDHNPFDPDGIGHIAVRMFLNEYLKLLHESLRVVVTRANTRLKECTAESLGIFAWEEGGDFADGVALLKFTP